MKRIIVCLFSVVLVFFSYGQSKEKIVPHSVLQSPAICIFNQWERPVADAWQSVISKAGSYSEKSTWKIYSELNDELGQIHKRVQFYYNGVAVELSTAIVHQQDGWMLSFNGDLVPEDLLAGKLVLTEEEALKKALNFLPSEHYYWQNPEQNKALQYATGNNDTSFYPKATLKYCPKNFQLNGIHRLAYTFAIYSEEPLSGKRIYVDAENGEILASEDLICHVEVKGSAVTKYSGNRSIQTDSTAPGAYRLREAGRGKGIETYNLKTSTNYATGVDFTDADNVWNNVNGAKDEVATDAHWGAEMTYDYFMKEHNRNSFDANGAKILSYVHYSANYNNAFWDGVRMTYGDGNGTTFTPLTAIDVCGHEITHAVTTNTAGLVYSYESGALNESFSDVFGNSVEIWARPSQWNWRIGEDITPSKNGIRSMLNPNLFSHPKFYKGVSWYGGTADNGGVHTNSGVQNYWYYLIANGAKGTNEKGWTFQIDTLGIVKAGKIAYRNLSVYLTKNAQYADARTFSIMSASDLYGQCSKEVIAVTNAWWVCGVGAKYDSGFVKANFLGDTLACTTGKALKFINLSDNFISCRWDFGDGNTSTSNNPTNTYNNFGKYSVKLVARSCFKSKYDSITRVQYVKIDSTIDICNGVKLPMTGTDSAIRCWGFVYDDGGEGNYGALKQVNFKLKVPGADSIRFRFLVMDYENGFDSVVVFKNSISWANKIGRYTGTTLPFAGNWTAIKGDALWFRQYSDPLLEGKGFKMQFIGIRPALSLDLGNDTGICYGDSVNIKPVVKGGYAPNFLYAWGDGQVTGSIKVAPLSSRKYYLTVKDACTGKSVRDSIAITVRAPLKVKLGKDTIVCKGRSVKLDAIPSGGLSAVYSYNWNNGLPSLKTQTVTPLITTTYRVILNDGCTDKPDTAYRIIFVKPALQAKITAGATPVCIGKTVNLTAAGSGGDTAGYSYTWNNGLGTGSSKTITLTDTTKVILTLSDGCTIANSKDSVQLFTFPALRIQKHSDTNICRGTSVNLKTVLTGGKGSGYNYLWKGGQTTSNLAVTPVANGWYVVTGFDACSPSVKDSIQVTLHSPLSINRIKDTTLCSGQSLSLNMLVSGGRSSSLDIKWIPSSVSGLNPTLSPAPGVQKYIAIATDACTVKEDSCIFNLTMLQPLTAGLIISPSPVCEGDSVSISVSVSGGKTATRTWSLDGAPISWLNNKQKPLSTHNYVLSVTDGCSVPSSANFNLTVNTRPAVTFSTGDYICVGDTASFTHFCSQPVKLTWIFGKGDSLDGTGSGKVIRRVYTKPGVYSFTARSTTPQGCSQLHQINQPTNLLYVLQAPVASFSPDANIVNIQSPLVLFTDKSKNCNNWNWNFGDGNLSTTAGSVSHSYSDTGRFKVQLIVDTMGVCYDTTYAYIWVRNKYEVFLPTSFSPNDDGRNDRYVPYMTGVKSFELHIYDRWGNKVFETNNLAKMWDGRGKDGKYLQAEVFVVSLIARDNDGYRHEERGTITIVR